MKTIPAISLCGVLASGLAAVLWAVGSAGHAQLPEMPKEEQLKPKWEISDSWVVETANKPVTFTTRTDAKEAPKNDPQTMASVVTRWKFTVAASEQLAGVGCFRVEVTVLPDAKGQPVTKLWYDANAKTLRQVETQLPVNGGFVTVTESYAADPNAPVPPAIGPLTVLPVELPMFVGGRAGETTFSYDAVSGKAGSKREAVDVIFAVDVKQAITPITTEKARGMLPKSFIRDLTQKQLVEVKLNSPERQVTQLWEVGQPWPVFTSNGTSESRLISVTRAKP